MELDLTLLVIASSVIKLFVLVSIGFFVYKAGIIDDSFLDKLSIVLLYAIFPSLIISKTISHFTPLQFSFWWTIPIVAIFFAIAGIIIGFLLLCLIKGFDYKDEFICSIAFQNAGYLPMNLIAFSFSGILADRLLIYLFLFLAGFNFVVWTFVPLFLERKRGYINWRHMMNPPVIATLLSILWVFIFGSGSITPLIMDPLRQLGEASFPVAMIVLGGYLCRYQAHIPYDKAPLAVALAGKLIIFPALVLFILFFVPMSIDCKFFIFLESIMPTAISLVVIGAFARSNNRFFSSVIFYSHLFAIITIPLWLGLFSVVFDI